MHPEHWAEATVHVYTCEIVVSTLPCRHLDLPPSLKRQTKSRMLDNTSENSREKGLTQKYLNLCTTIPKKIGNTSKNSRDKGLTQKRGGENGYYCNQPRRCSSDAGTEGMTVSARSSSSMLAHSTVATTTHSHLRQFAAGNLKAEAEDKQTQVDME